MRKGHYLSLLILVALFNLGCTDNTEPNVMELTVAGNELTVQSPEYAAIKFFDHIYNDTSIDGALPFCSERLRRTVARYHTNRNVQRHVLNLRYDSVTMEVRSGQTRFESIVGKKSDVMLYFSGFRDGKKIDDIRRVEMSRADGRWVIERITPFPY